ncbi:hypothetical protein ACIA8K_12445 [Catenuloplanes sp. NPDC051500]|uniref:hypothetical protein n=1 Tax=Catenuloplanes sp. NPDC051500 TaxID=3363959 RepID=UPI00379A71CE
MPTTAQELTHTATPGKDCRVCDEPWPCAPAKVELLEEHGRTPSALRLYLFAHLTDAIDMRMDGDLYDRFIGWTGRPSMHRNYVVTHMSALDNLPTGTFINGVFIDVCGVQQIVTAEPPMAVLHLVLDPGMLAHAMNAESPATASEEDAVAGLEEYLATRPPVEAPSDQPTMQVLPWQGGRPSAAQPRND